MPMWGNDRMRRHSCAVVLVHGMMLHASARAEDILGTDEEPLDPFVSGRPQ